MQELLNNHVYAVSTTVINAGDRRIKLRAAEHRIVQEALCPDNGEIYVVIANMPMNGTISLSGDEQQLRQKQEGIKDNFFANYSNYGVFERWLPMGIKSYTLVNQYRAIKELSDIMSALWYQGKIVSKVSSSTRPNVSIVSKVLKDFRGVNGPIAFLDVQGESHLVGPTHSKANATELQVAQDICQRLSKKDHSHLSVQGACITPAKASCFLHGCEDERRPELYHG